MECPIFLQIFVGHRGATFHDMWHHDGSFPGEICWNCEMSFRTSCTTWRTVKPSPNQRVSALGDFRPGFRPRFAGNRSQSNLNAPADPGNTRKPPHAPARGYRTPKRRSSGRPGILPSETCGIINYSGPNQRISVRNDGQPTSGYLFGNNYHGFAQSSFGPGGEGRQLREDVLSVAEPTTLPEPTPTMPLPVLANYLKPSTPGAQQLARSSCSGRVPC